MLWTRYPKQSGEELAVGVNTARRQRANYVCGKTALLQERDVIGFTFRS